MVQSALDIKVWKEIAISKQLLIKTATDALGIAPECSEKELKDALAKSIKKMGDAERKISSIQNASALALSAIENKLKISEKARLEVDESNTELKDQKKTLDKLLESERKLHAKALFRVNADLDKKTKQLKNINITLADTPENVAKKLKILNKKKFDESAARKRAEETARTLKKDTHDLKKKVKTHAEKLEQAEKLVEMYRALRTFCNEQFTQLKGLIENQDDLKAMPDQDQTLLDALEEKKKEDQP